MSLTIIQPDDFHAHFRQGSLLRVVVPLTAAHFARAIIMSNTKPPIGPAQVRPYREEILQATGDGFQPLMTIKILPSTTPSDIWDAKEAGAVAAKLYTEGVTSNAEDGVKMSDFPDLDLTFSEMQEADMPLLLHGEKPGEFCLVREQEFLSTLFWLVDRYPRLRIVLEHITTAAAVRAVLDLPDTVAATITAHHLVMTLDDVVGDRIRPHNFCKPLPKLPSDRQAVVGAAVSGNSKFFFGSDTAPWLIGEKECPEGCAGCFTAPVALALVTGVFERHNRLDRLERFLSTSGARFYGLPINRGRIKLVKEPWVVPMEYGGVRPFAAGETLQWRVASV